MKDLIRVQYMDHLGNDNSVCNAARVSFAKEASNYTDEQNAKLIDYLAKHKHEIPFAHTAITLRVQAPISIRTQCYKHKIGFVENEVSRRYVKDKPSFFTPVFRHAPDGNIKQGSGKIIDSVPVTGTMWEGLDDYEDGITQKELQQAYIYHLKSSINLYDSLIKAGVAPEQARFVLPQGVMTEFVWTGNVASFARMFNQRTDSHAQKEIQDLAKMVGEIIEPLYPVSWTALTE